MSENIINRTDFSSGVCPTPPTELRLNGEIGMFELLGEYELSGLSLELKINFTEKLLNNAICFLRTNRTTSRYPLPKIMEMVRRGLIRYIDFLNQAGRFADALKIINALRQGGFPNISDVDNAVELARLVGGEPFPRAGRALQTSNPPLEKILNERPLNMTLGDFYFKIGETYKGLKQYSSAMEFYEAALGFFPTISPKLRMDNRPWNYEPYLRASIAETRRDRGELISPEEIQRFVDIIDLGVEVLGGTFRGDQSKKLDVKKRFTIAVLGSYLQHPSTFNLGKQILDYIIFGRGTLPSPLSNMTVSTEPPFSASSFSDVDKKRAAEAWLDALKSKAFRNPNNENPELSCSDTECQEIMTMLDEMPSITNNAEVLLEAKKAKVSILINMAKRNGTAGFRYLREALRIYDADIRNDIATISWLAWTALNMAKDGDRDAMTMLLEIAKRPAGARTLADEIVNERGEKGKIKSAIVDTLVRLDRFDDAIEYAIEIKSLSDINYAFWGKIKNLGGATDPRALDTLLAYAAILKASVDGTDTVRGDAWREPSNKAGGLLSRQIPRGGLDERLNLIIVLESISSLSGNEVYRDMALAEAETALPLAERAFASRPSTDNAFNYAILLNKIGSSKLETAQRPSALQMLFKAGYLLQELTGESGLFERPSDIRASINPITGSDDEAKAKKIQALNILRGLIGIKIETLSQREEIQNLNAASQRIREQIRVLGGRPSESEDAVLFIRQGRPSEAISLITRILPGLISSRQNMKEISGLIGILAWAYEAAKQYDKAIAIYGALLHGTKDDSLPSPLKEIVAFAADNRSALTAEQPQSFSEGALHLKLGKALKGNGNLDLAKAELELAITTLGRDSDGGREATLELANIAVNTIDNMIREGNYTGALNVAGTQDFEEIERIIETLSRAGTRRELIFGAYRSLAWLYSLRALIREKLDGIGRGTEDYSKAAVIMEKLLTFDERVIREAQDSEGNPLSRNSIILQIAGLYQGAGNGDPSKLRRALEFYNRLTTPSIKTSDPKVFASASAGKAEVLLSQAKSAQTGQRELVIQALSVIKEALPLFARISTEEKERVLSSLMWALSMLADIKIKERGSLDAGQLYPEQELSLIIFKVLLKGEAPASFGERIDAIIPQIEGFPLSADDMKTFMQTLSAQRGDHSSSFKFRAQYIGLLLSAKQTSEAVAEFRIIASIDTATLSNEEKRALAGIYTAVASYYCFQMKRYDLAGTYFNKALELFGTDIPEDSKISIFTGLAKVYEEDKKYSEAADKLKEILTLPSIRALLQNPDMPVPQAGQEMLERLVSTYFTLGNLYSYKIGNRQEALDYFKLATRHARRLTNDQTRRKFIAEACFGVGDLYRIKDRNYERAHHFYDLGIDVLLKETTVEPSRQTLLARLYAAKASAFALDRKYSEAHRYFEMSYAALGELNREGLAAEVITYIDKVREAVDRDVVNINQDKLFALSSIRIGGSYVVDTYRGGSENSTTEGWVPSIEATFKLTRELSINLGYSAGLERHFDFEVPSQREPLSRLDIDRPHVLTTGLSYSTEWEHFNLRLGLSHDTTIARYATHGYDWKDDFSGFYGHRQDESDTFISSRLRSRFGFDYKTMLGEDTFPTFLTTGFDIEGSYLLHSSESPLIKAQRIDQEEFPEGDIEVGRSPEQRERFALSINPYARFSKVFNITSGFLLDTSLMVGAGLEYNPLDATGNGLWPVMGNPDWYAYLRGYGTLGMSTNFVFGPGLRMSVPLYFNGRFGNILGIDTGTGFRYTGDSWSLELMLKYQQFRDDRSDIKSFVPTLQVSF